MQKEHNWVAVYESNNRTPLEVTFFAHSLPAAKSKARQLFNNEKLLAVKKNKA